jgi:hypothetical protein
LSQPGNPKGNVTMDQIRLFGFRPCGLLMSA